MEGLRTYGRKSLTNQKVANTEQQTAFVIKIKEEPEFELKPLKPVRTYLKRVKQEENPDPTGDRQTEENTQNHSVEKSQPKPDFTFVSVPEILDKVLEEEEISEENTKRARSKRRKLEIPEPSSIEESTALEPPKPFFKSVKIYLSEENRLSDVCRICFCAIQEDEESFELNEHSFRGILSQVLPDLDLGMFQNSVACKKCKEAVTASFELKTAWLSTEEKLKRTLEKQSKGDPDKSLVLVAKDKKSFIDEERKVFQTRTEAREERCDKCGKSFLTASRLRQHINNVHYKGQKMKGEFPCLICNATLSSNLFLKKHMDRIHSKPSSWFECVFCRKRFTSSALVRRHYVTAHADYKSQKGNKFISVGPRRRSLAKYREMACDICKTNFGSIQGLIMHVKATHREALGCPFCGKMLLSERKLVEHKVKVHGWVKEEKVDDWS